MQSVYTHIPYTLLWDKAPVDISFLFEQERPAGKHGFMTARDGRFLFEDGTEMRFWGTNFNSGANFPEHSHAEKVARRLAAMGINIVRFHQLDSEWSTPNLFQFTKGPRCATTRRLDPRSLERLDYLIYCLKEEGIYVYLDMMCYRKFKSGDGVENTVLMPEAGRPYSNFARRLIELQKELNGQLWGHYNPYTKLAYKDDPVIVMTEITNENDLFMSWHLGKITLEPYRTELAELYARWAEKNGVAYEGEPPGGIDFENNGDENMARFKSDVMKDYYREMMDDCRRIGVKIPITGTNWSINTAILEAQMATDYTDSHAYCWDGDQRRFTDMSMIRQRGNMLSSLSINRVADKPFFVSEWDEPWPSMYRADSPLLMAAAGSFQGWYGFTIHTYRYGTNEQESVTSKIGRDIVIGNSYYRGIFDTYNDPAKFGLFYHAALITRRGDVRRAEKTVAIAHENIAGPSVLDGPEHFKAYEMTPEKHRVVTELPGREHGSAADIRLGQRDETEWGAACEVLSDTGEMYRNLEKGYGYIDSPMTKAVYGFHAKGCTYALNGMDISVDNDFATLAVSSISDKPIASSDNLLLTAVGRADNKDAVYQEGHTRQADCGTGPIMAEVIRAKISMETCHANLRIWSVDNEGFYTGAVPFHYEDGRIIFEIGGEYASIYYLIQAQ
ncbi:MAG: hypothetical protein FWF86_03810 [Clostridia bacterium]|nr:hypothetical protein [Clostridia bacterium]